MSGQVLSFTLRAKEEIFAAKPLKGPRWLSFAYGLFLLGSQMDANTLTLTTEHKVVSLCYAEAFRILTGRRLDYKRSGKVGGRMRYHSSCSHPDSLTKLSRSLGFDANQPLSASHLSAEGAHRAFLSGAFMACASVTDPAKDYHLSFKPATEAAGDCLFELLCQMGYPPKTTLYRGEQLLYFKESEPIEDILTALGAPICSLELMETKVFRDLQQSQSHHQRRNGQHRQNRGLSRRTNCRYPLLKRQRPVTVAAPRAAGDSRLAPAPPRGFFKRAG